MANLDHSVLSEYIKSTQNHKLRSILVMRPTLCGRDGESKKNVLQVLGYLLHIFDVKVSMSMSSIEETD